MWPSGVFAREINPPDHPCKSHDGEHQWADLDSIVMKNIYKIILV